MNKTNVKLPKIGDRLMRTMSSTVFRENELISSPCIVVYVNSPKYYYTVEFIETGIRESYKIVDVNEVSDFKNDFRKAFGYEPKGVYVYESGMIYPSISSCAKEIGVRPGTLSNHLHGRLKHVKGYHVYML